MVSFDFEPHDADVKVRPAVAAILLSLFGIPLVTLFLAPLLSSTDFETLLWANDLIKWVLAGTVLWLAIRVEGRPLESLNIRVPSLRLVVLSIPLALVVMFTAGYLSQTIQTVLDLSVASSQGTETADKLTGLSLIQRLSIIVTAGVTEEILYRGVPIERIEDVTGNTYLAGSLTVFMFVLIHIPGWGWIAAIQQTLLAIGITLLYLKYRSLALVIFIHIIIDFIPLILFPLLDIGI